MPRPYRFEHGAPYTPPTKPPAPFVPDRNFDGDSVLSSGVDALDDSKLNDESLRDTAGGDVANVNRR